MKNSEIAIWIGAIAGVLLVVLVIMQNDETVNVEPVFQVSGITPETAAVFSQERVAKASIAKDSLLGWFSYKLGLEQTDAAKTIGILESNNSVTRTRLESEAQIETTRVTSSSQTEIARILGLSQVQIAQLQADAEKYKSKQENKGKNTSAIGGLLGGIAKIFSFF